MARPTHRVAPDLTSVPEIDWARLAAYIDSDGHISITMGTRKNAVKSTGRTRLYLRVMVTNTDPRLIRWLVANFGGGVGNYPHKNPKHRHTFKWGTSCRQTEAILKKCLPYFIAKRDQADIALAFQATFVGFRRGHQIPDDVQRLRESFHQQLKDTRWATHDFSDLRPEVNPNDPVH